MISVKEQQNLFIQIANTLPREITVYAIGGTALMFLGLEEATLDLDLIFNNKKDRAAFKEAAKSLGYKELDSIVIYGVKSNKPEMLTLKDARLDLFLSEVIDFVFSDNMKKRSKQVHQFGDNLILKIADVHDIILMKCATKRTKDEEDIVGLIKTHDINWKILVEEAKEQISLGKETAILQLGTLLEKLKERHKINVPKEILNELWDLMKKQAELKMKK